MIDDVLIVAREIPNEKIIRFLGYEISKAGEKTIAMIDALKEELISVSQPKYVYKEFDVLKSEHSVKVVGTDIIIHGKLIQNFLKNIDKIILMAATLGQQVDRFLIYTQKRSILEGTLADAIASAYVENLCDALQATLSQEYNINGRISCGFHDFSIETQPDILKALDTPKAIGLYCNESLLMLPSKSVTAVMGVKF